MQELLITSDSAIMLGKPVIRGTRITVEHIIRELAGGMTIEDLLEAHPHITREEIKAALKFAAESIRFVGKGTMEDSLIVSDPNIMVGKPVIRGTRIAVELILRKLAAGQTVEQILEDYPHITREGIQAALEFGSTTNQGSGS